MPKDWRKNIAKMNDRMIHRGPDAEGIWADENAEVVLGHRRLSILDLSPSGTQPMISHSGRFVIVLNGEIYNYKKIAATLIENHKVFAFKGTSDTEVLVEACEAYGIEETLAMAKGMFAFALYDTREKKLFLARDRMGEKPLYYGFLGERFVFASDIAAIRENIYFEEELDRDALMLYFGFGYIPAPYSIYKNIKKLEAGSLLTASFPFKKIKISKYWDVMQIARKGQQNLFKGSEKEAADCLESLLKAAIKEQMVADVPVGAFLSGGIDSTTVVAIMQSLNSKKIKTFTIGLKEQGFNEAVYAKETAGYLGTDHTELYISDREAQKVIPMMAHIYGEPFADSSQIPMYLVSKLARESVTVSLSGDGGDELFGGYNSYSYIEDLWRKIGHIPLPFRKWGSYIAGKIEIPYAQDVARYLPARSAENAYELTGSPVGSLEGLVKDAKIPDYKYSQYPTGYLPEIVNNIMLMDMLMYHPDDILVKVDRAGMAVSLESRIPMLDQDILEYAWSLPLEYKRTGNAGKKVLRNVLYRYVPKKMMERPKTGFSVPIAEWIRNGDLREWAETLIENGQSVTDGVLNRNHIKNIWQEFLGGKNKRAELTVWYFLMFEEWYCENHH